MHSTHGIESNDALDTSIPLPYGHGVEVAMSVPKRANDVRPTEPIPHGAYLCLTAAHRERRIAGELRALAERLELRNEAEPGDDHPLQAIAFLRRVDATPPPRASDLADDALLAAAAIIHVAAPGPRPVQALCDE